MWPVVEKSFLTEDKVLSYIANTIAVDVLGPDSI